ncbi:MAG: CPBP family intramembrane metalloprotease [Spirochaetales bacterium]|nr:CPBP family intramembrane metalloprotease [Spirochaetales bacterium]
MKRKIIAYSVVCLLLLYVVEQVLMTPYFLKTIIKIPMFTVFPFMIQRFLLKSKFSVRIKKSEQKFILLSSIFIFVIITVVAFVLKSFIDIEAISSDFANRMKLSGQGMILAGVYTIFVNSLIEEYFFRGFIFQELLKRGWKKPAYIISSAAFAMYHVTVFEAWFGIGLMMVMLLGLFVGGLIFAYFVKKTESILASWIIHISADLALVVFGIFGLGLLGFK